MRGRAATSSDQLVDQWTYCPSLVTALAVGLGAELLLFACAVAAFISTRRRRSRLQVRFEAAAVEARRLALDARIADASVAELSELVVEDLLREMGMDWSTGAP